MARTGFLITHAEAAKRLGNRYDEQAEKSPRMLEIPKRTYINANIYAVRKNDLLREYA